MVEKTIRGRAALRSLWEVFVGWVSEGILNPTSELDLMIFSHYWHETIWR